MNKKLKDEWHMARHMGHMVDASYQPTYTEFLEINLEKCRAEIKERSNINQQLKDAIALLLC